MLKKLAYAGAFVGAVATAAAVGCGGDDTTKTNYDFATSTSTDGSTDLSAISYFATTVNAIDTAKIGDANKLNENETAVSLSGLIVLEEPNGFSAKINVTGDGCRYEVWAQDPQCTTPPCGIILETQAIINPNGTGQYCPYAYQVTDATNFLKETEGGDVINVKGRIDTFPSTGSAYDGGTSAILTAHEVELDALTTTTEKGPLPAATVVTDTNPSMFVPFTGAGWTMYEGMLIQLKPASGKFTTELVTSSKYTDTCTGVTGNTNGSFTVSPGGALFEDTYNFTYVDKDMGDVTNCFPLNGSTYSSISGIVSTSFGGGILPISSTDFQP